MNNFETVERCGRVHVVKNGVESAWYLTPDGDNLWSVYYPVLYGRERTLAGALGFIAAGMDDWHTASEAADRLVELGAFEKAPTPHDICMWARLGLLPSAVKIQGKGGAGQGGAWRIPEGGLVEFAKRREQR